MLFINKNCLNQLSDFQLYHGWQVNFQWNDDEFRFVLDQHAKLDFYSVSSLKQYVAPLGHITLNPSQPVFALLCTALIL
jgi:hypothetical protein